MPRFLEFFAGGGMARAGLGPRWECVFANDFDVKKGTSYRSNWGNGDELRLCDMRHVRSTNLPVAELAWASFPCQDLSLAGGGAGLTGARSSTFFPFWDIMRGLIAEGRPPHVIVLENVVGALTSHAGGDFETISRTFVDAGYRFGAVVIDAALFVPHSRPRLFVIGVRRDADVDPSLVLPDHGDPFHPRGLCRAVSRLSERSRSAWVWWHIPTPPQRVVTLAALIEETPTGVAWHTSDETAALVRLMSALNLAKLDAARHAGRRLVGCIYKRTRHQADGTRIQRAEVRFDDLAGCLRTPAGGSSRQVIVVVDGARVRSRLISPRETARLMGLPDSYKLPNRYNDSYHLTGDGVAVPVVRHLAEHIIEPLIINAGIYSKAA